jgi:DNA replication protein DnaC
MQELIAGRAPWPLYLHGPAGTGKTSAALAMLDACGPAPAKLRCSSPILNDWFAGFLDTRNLPRLKIGCDKGRFQWRRGADSGDLSWEMLARAAQKAPVFALDEIGLAREASDFSREILIEVLNWRCNDPVRPVVVTSNRDPDELAAAYDERVASRILCGTVFHLGGPDRRHSE